MNESFMKSVIKDRQREVTKYVENNQIYSQYKDSAASRRESTGQGKNSLSWWLLTVAKRLRGVFTIINEGSVKVKS